MSNTPTVTPGWLTDKAAAIVELLDLDPARLDTPGDVFHVPEYLRSHYAAAVTATPMRDLIGDLSIDLSGRDTDPMARVSVAQQVAHATGELPPRSFWFDVVTADRVAMWADEILDRHRVTVPAWRRHSRLWEIAVTAHERQVRAAQAAAANDRERTCPVGPHLADTTWPRLVPSFTRTRTRLDSGPRLCDEHAAAAAVELGRRHVDDQVRALVDEVAPGSARATPTPADVVPRRGIFR